MKFVNVLIYGFIVMYYRHLIKFMNLASWDGGIFLFIMFALLYFIGGSVTNFWSDRCVWK
jgi:hypothetical protein